jgi:adenylate cyclase
MKTPQKLMAGLLIGVAAALLAWVCAAVGLLNVPEQITWDQRQRFFAQPVDESLPIRVILLDDQSLAWAQAGMKLNWPWPYEVYTPILDFCRRSGAKAIAFDVEFTEADRYYPPDVKKFADAIARAPDFVAAVVPGEHTSQTASWPEGIDRTGLAVVDGMDAYLSQYKPEGLTAQRVRFPFESIRRSAAGFGHILQDQDTVIRQTRPLIRFDGADIPTLGLTTYLTGSGLAVNDAEIVGDQLRIADKVVPLGDDGRAYLRYRKPRDHDNGHLYRSYSAAAVIQSQLRLAAGEEPTIDPAVFQNSYVFFGLSASSLYDTRPNPMSPLSPGVEVHATFLDNLLNNAFLHDANLVGVAVFTVFMSVLAALAVVFIPGTARLFAIYLVSLPIPVVLGFVMFRNGSAWPIAAPQLAVFTSLIGATVLSLATEGKQRRFIRRAFGHYLSPAVIERVIADPSLLRLGGERRVVSVMFVDLAGFTSVAERLDPPVLSELLNDYLSQMSEAILEEQGTLDKYQGDAVMAFWNAPLDQPDHALLACRAALRCREKLVGLRRKWIEHTGHEPKIRIGIHTGECVVGNMGSRQRFDYTVLGDTPNLASRLEGANKVFGTTILVSESTWSQAHKHLAGRAIGRVVVVGRAEPVNVYEPVSRDPKAQNEFLESFRSALRRCEQGDLIDAMHLFQKIEHDPAAKAYADRLASIMDSPSPAWDGVWNLLNK